MFRLSLFQPPSLRNTYLKNVPSSNYIILNSSHQFSFFSQKNENNSYSCNSTSFISSSYFQSNAHSNKIKTQLYNSNTNNFFSIPKISLFSFSTQASTQLQTFTNEDDEDLLIFNEIKEDKRLKKSEDMNFLRDQQLSIKEITRPFTPFTESVPLTAQKHQGNLKTSSEVSFQELALKPKKPIPKYLKDEAANVYYQNIADTWSGELRKAIFQAKVNQYSGEASIKKTLIGFRFIEPESVSSLVIEHLLYHILSDEDPPISVILTELTELIKEDIDSEFKHQTENFIDQYGVNLEESVDNKNFGLLSKISNKGLLELNSSASIDSNITNKRDGKYYTKSRMRYVKENFNDITNGGMSDKEWYNLCSHLIELAQVCVSVEILFNSDPRNTLGVQEFSDKFTYPFEIHRQTVSGNTITSSKPIPIPKSSISISPLTYEMAEEALQQQQQQRSNSLNGPRSITSSNKAKKGIQTRFVLKCTNKFEKLIRMGLLSNNEDKEPGWIIKALPKESPPIPWERPNVDEPIMRGRKFIMRVNPKGFSADLLRSYDLESVYRCLNIVDQTSWRINPFVYQVMTDLWETGGGLCTIPTRSDLPFLSDDENNLLNNRNDRNNDNNNRDLSNQMNIKNQLSRGFGGIGGQFLGGLRKRIQRFNVNSHSLRCDFLLKYRVATACLGKSEIYFPHTMDFRGRVYPVPPHLNHMGSDVSRGLLIFAQGRPLGEEGFFWLKVHLANLYGKDKISFFERVKFVDDHLPEIFDSVDHPLDGGMWWSHADDPWQCLGACWEVVNAIRSGSPENYVSHVPVHQDGSCNGLQHYSALGGDELGARNVNLFPADRPQDVYSGVLDLVCKKIETDAQAGDRVALMVAGKVTRKVIKQTVMTTVYGVTFIGARTQIYSHLREEGIGSENQRMAMSAYIAEKTFSAVREMFSGTKIIMAWLSKCAYNISKAGHPVQWITPLGLPCAQPYLQTKSETLDTPQFSTSFLREADEDQMDKNKQRSAFPPNFIHSLDATHMFLTALECHKNNIAFAAVHDSYWTHAGTVPMMGKILREQFVILHSIPLLEDLYHFWSIIYRDDLRNGKLYLPPVPKLNSFDMKAVLKSPYFFH